VTRRTSAIVKARDAVALPFFPDTRKSLIRALGHANDNYPGGWEQAWADFLLCYYPFIRGWCRRWDAANADDLTQEVLLQLVRKVGKFDPAKGTRFRGWLKKVVRNAVITAYRAKTRQVLPLETVDMAKVAAKTPDEIPDEALASLDRELEMADMLEKVRARVKPASWRAFWEYKVEGRSVSDVARELDMTIQAVCVTSKRISGMLQQEAANLPAPERDEP